MSAIIYILYNADASAMGKIQYAYRKLTAPPDESPCAACDLTHNGLRLTETKEWSNAKSRIGAEVKQLHKDEADRQIVDFVKTQGIEYPLVLGRPSAGEDLRVLMTAQDLAASCKDHESFLSMLARKSAENDVKVDIKS
ncbi:MAG: hypothetical protein M1836_005770 [Candelina mexicana]|nr:MAG: hypothetical protein M1836_005770 [Candelina mexicana]